MAHVSARLNFRKTQQPAAANKMSGSNARWRRDAVEIPQAPRHRSNDAFRQCGPEIRRLSMDVLTKLPRPHDRLAPRQTFVALAAARSADAVCGFYVAGSDKRLPDKLQVLGAEPSFGLTARRGGGNVVFHVGPSSLAQPKACACALVINRESPSLPNPPVFYARRWSKYASTDEMRKDGNRACLHSSWAEFP